jgi:molybdenum cofactor sulfurtransferase
MSTPTPERREHPEAVEAARQRDAFAGFLQRFPAYVATSAVDEQRRREYSRLDAAGQVYLDYTGGSLHADAQVAAHVNMLAGAVFGNPHSANPASAATTTLVERARRRVLEYFHADPRDYTAVFTANASGALKLVGESYPFAAGGTFLLTVDNHNSVNGIREFAEAGGATVVYAPITVPDLRIDQEALSVLLDASPGNSPRLFAFPAQSNFSGVEHPLELIDRAHAAGWDVLLDAAAFVPTNRLDLQVVRPDFVAVSFYKMFGYPSGVGCLIARREALARLRRPWFAGGTVNFATVQGGVRVLARGEAGFEDGTLNYLAIPAVDIGLRHLESIGIDTIKARVQALTGWTLEQLLDLRHANGRHMVRIYGPTTGVMRGGTITFNLYDPDGHLIDYRRVEELAGRERISLRTGCFCNPGAGEAAEGLTEEDMLSGVRAGTEMSLPRFLEVIHHRGGKSAGAIRASLGIVSNFADVYRFVEFVARFGDQTRMTIGEVTFDVDSCRVIRDGS